MAQVEGPASVAFRDGLIREPTQGLPLRPDRGGIRYEVDGKEVEIMLPCLLHGTVFTDGAATLCEVPSFSRAGWAAVLLHPTEQQVIASVRGPVRRSYPTTAPAAEHLAVSASVETFGEVASVYHSDHLSIPRVFDSGREAMLHPAKRYAGVWRTTMVSDGWSRVAQVQRVKAHVPQNSLSIDDVFGPWRAFGNGEADRLAGQAARKILGGDTSCVKSATKAAQTARQFHIVLSKATAL